MASRLIDLISKKKTSCTCSTLFLVISRKQICTCSTLFCLSLPLFCTTTTPFLRLKRQISQLHIIFMEQLSYVFTQYFVVCVHVRFYFSLPLIFILLAASISHFFTAAMFFSLQNTSPLFSITRSSSFSVNHVRIKNNAEKDKTFFLFFLSKSPGGHVKT